MRGVFFKNKNTFAIICIVVGVTIIALFTAHIFSGAENPLHTNDMAFTIVCSCLGLIPIVFGVLVMLHNRGSCLTVTENHISAKYNWNKKIMFYFNEIAFVDSQPFTLIIRTKSGKRYVIAGLINAQQICDTIRKKMPLEIDKAVTKESLLSEINLLPAKRKKEIIFLIIFNILNFLNILFCVFLTGEKDLTDFTRNDWIVFVIFCVTETLIFGAVFYFGKAVGEKSNLLNEKTVLLRKLILLTTPTLTGNLISSYIDSKYKIRATVFGFPNSNDLYFCIEEVDWKYDLVCTYRSPVYTDPEDFKEDLSVDDLIRIK